MGRVETRLYKRKRQRARMGWLLLGTLAVGMLLWRSGRVPFVTERISQPTPTPVTSSFDKTQESREVTLAAEIWYAIQTGVFSTEDAANQKADAYTQRGAPGKVIRDGEKWRVFIACYPAEGDAAAVRTRLEQNQHVETYLYPWQCPELRLRLTGMAGQLDAVEAGFTMMTSTAAALRDAAIALDAGEFTTQDAAAAVKAREEQLLLWEQTARDRFGKKPPDLVQSMLNLSSAWRKECAALRENEGATELSAALKAQAMAMYDSVIAWRNALSAQ